MSSVIKQESLLFVTRQAQCTMQKTAAYSHVDQIWAVQGVTNIPVGAYCCVCCCSFGLVAIPVQMRVYLVAGALAVIVVSFMWEHSLRQIFPAAKPPSKGYMVHKQQLKGLAAQRVRSKKDL